MAKTTKSVGLNSQKHKLTLKNLTTEETSLPENQAADLSSLLLASENKSDETLDWLAQLEQDWKKRKIEKEDATKQLLEGTKEVSFTDESILVAANDNKSDTQALLDSSCDITSNDTNNKTNNSNDLTSHDVNCHPVRHSSLAPILGIGALGAAIAAAASGGGSTPVVATTIDVGVNANVSTIHVTNNPTIPVNNLTSTLTYTFTNGAGDPVTGTIGPGSSGIPLPPDTTYTHLTIVVGGQTIEIALLWSSDPFHPQEFSYANDSPLIYAANTNLAFVLLDSGGNRQFTSQDLDNAYGNNISSGSIDIIGSTDITFTLQNSLDLNTGDRVFLDFAGTSLDDFYTINSIDATHFSINSLDLDPASFSASGDLTVRVFDAGTITGLGEGSVTITDTTHQYLEGDRVYLDFEGTSNDGFYTVTEASSEDSTFTISADTTLLNVSSDVVITDITDISSANPLVSIDTEINGDVLGGIGVFSHYQSSDAFFNATFTGSGDTHTIHNISVTATSADSNAIADIHGNVRVQATTTNGQSVDEYLYGVTVEASGVSSDATLHLETLNSSSDLHGQINDLIVTTGPVNSAGAIQPDSLSIGDGAQAEFIVSGDVLDIVARQVSSNDLINQSEGITVVAMGDESNAVAALNTSETNIGYNNGSNTNTNPIVLVETNGAEASADLFIENLNSADISSFTVKTEGLVLVGGVSEFHVHDAYDATARATVNNGNLVEIVNATISAGGDESDASLNLNNINQLTIANLNIVASGIDAESSILINNSIASFTGSADMTATGLDSTVNFNVTDSDVTFNGIVTADANGESSDVNLNFVSTSTDTSIDMRNTIDFNNDVSLNASGASSSLEVAIENSIINIVSSDIALNATGTDAEATFLADVSSDINVSNSAIRLNADGGDAEATMTLSGQTYFEGSSSITMSANNTSHTELTIDNISGDVNQINQLNFSDPSLMALDYSNLAGLQAATNGLGSEGSSNTLNIESGNIGIHDGIFQLFSGENTINIGEGATVTFSTDHTVQGFGLNASIVSLGVDHADNTISISNIRGEMNGIVGFSGGSSDVNITIDSGDITIHGNHGSNDVGLVDNLILSNLNTPYFPRNIVGPAIRVLALESSDINVTLGEQVTATLDGGDIDAIALGSSSASIDIAYASGSGDINNILSFASSDSDAHIHIGGSIDLDDGMLFVAAGDASSASVSIDVLNIGQLGSVDIAIVSVNQSDVDVNIGSLTGTVNRFDIYASNSEGPDITLGNGSYFTISNDLNVVAYDSGDINLHLSNDVTVQFSSPNSNANISLLADNNSSIDLSIDNAYGSANILVSATNSSDIDLHIGGSGLTIEQYTSLASAVVSASPLDLLAGNNSNAAVTLDTVSFVDASISTDAKLSSNVNLTVSNVSGNLHDILVNASSDSTNTLNIESGDLSVHDQFSVTATGSSDIEINFGNTSVDFSRNPDFSEVIFGSINLDATDSFISLDIANASGTLENINMIASSDAEIVTNIGGSVEVKVSLDMNADSSIIHTTIEQLISTSADITINAINSSDLELNITHLAGAVKTFTIAADNSTGPEVIIGAGSDLSINANLIVSASNSADIDLTISSDVTLTFNESSLTVSAINDSTNETTIYGATFNGAMGLDVRAEYNSSTDLSIQDASGTIAGLTAIADTSGDLSIEILGSADLTFSSDISITATNSSDITFHIDEFNATGTDTTLTVKAGTIDSLNGLTSNGSSNIDVDLGHSNVFLKKIDVAAFDASTVDVSITNDARGNYTAIGDGSTDIDVTVFASGTSSTAELHMQDVISLSSTDILVHSDASGSAGLVIDRLLGTINHLDVEAFSSSTDVDLTLFHGVSSNSDISSLNVIAGLGLDESNTDNGIVNIDISMDINNHGIIQDTYIASIGNGNEISINIDQNVHGGIVHFGSLDTNHQQVNSIDGTVNLTYSHETASELIFTEGANFARSQINLNFNFDDMNLSWTPTDGASYSNHLITMDGYSSSTMYVDMTFNNFLASLDDISMNDSLIHISNFGDANITNNVISLTETDIFNDALSFFASNDTDKFYFEAYQVGNGSATGFLFYDADAATDGYTSVFKLTNIDYALIDTQAEMNSYVSSLLVV
jgi:hypothetical protein